MATWPTTLPAPLIAGYSLQALDQTIRTEMETGTPRVRRRTAARLDRLDASWHFTEAQFDAFRDFFDDSSTGLSGGATWCTMVLKVGAGGAASYDARFVGAYSAELVSRTMWRVSAQLEVRHA